MKWLIRLCRRLFGVEGLADEAGFDYSPHHDKYRDR